MWTVVYVARKQAVAERVRNMLETEGLLAKLRPLGSGGNGKKQHIEVLVPESEIEEASQLLGKALAGR